MMHRSRHKVLIFLVAILLLANGALLAFFINRKPEDKRPEGNNSRRDRSAVMREYLKDSIGFNEQQLAQFDQVRQQHRENVKTLFDDMRTAKVAFYKLVNQPDTDSAQNAAASVIAEKQKALDMAFFKHFQEIRALCRPEQIPAYDSLVQQIVKRMISPSRRGDPRQKKEDRAVKK